MAGFRIGLVLLLLGTVVALPRGAFAQCVELQSLAAERAEALHLARKNIKELTRMIADASESTVIEELEADRRHLREQHAAIVKKIEANGQRLIEECADDV